MGEMRNAHNDLVGKPERKVSFENIDADGDIIKMHLQETDMRMYVDWIHLAQKAQQWVLLSMVLKLHPSPGYRLIHYYFSLWVVEVYQIYTAYFSQVMHFIVAWMCAVRRGKGTGHPTPFNSWLNTPRGGDT
jgi:hypothetical protein